MKTATYRRGDGGLPARAAAFCLLALAVTLLQAREARAQWTSGGGTSSTTDNVGIGTTTPAVPLQIRVPSGDVITRLSNAGGAAGALDLRYKFEFSQHRMGLTDGNGQWMFYTRYAPSNADSVGFFPGRVGVGTETPGYPLTVRANTNIAPLNLIGGTGSVEIWKDANPLPSKAVAFGSAIPGSPAGDDINLSTYNGSAWASRLTVVNATGNVGIGTTAPQQKLHVMGSIQAQGTNVNGDISVMSADPTKGYWDFYSSGVNGSMGFYDVLSVTLPLTIEKAAPSHSFYIKSNGNLGIGTNAPAAKLDVNGDIRVSGNINAKYQDVAEWVPSVQKLAAG
ncbi:MAG TPA: hypothetical protein VM864_02505, partial [Pyrinomonadaceae bacterium]|nr:hypothetical protein [Pyrinomonadaceae bacterium]